MCCHGAGLWSLLFSSHSIPHMNQIYIWQQLSACLCCDQIGMFGKVVWSFSIRTQIVQWNELVTGKAHCMLVQWTAELHGLVERVDGEVMVQHSVASWFKAGFKSNQEDISRPFRDTCCVSFDLYWTLHFTSQWYTCNTNLYYTVKPYPALLFHTCISEAAVILQCSYSVMRRQYVYAPQ